MWTYLLLSAGLWLAARPQQGRAVQEEKVCIVKPDGPVSSWSTKDFYNYYRDSYTNCTIIDGNLRLDSLRGEKFDLSFVDQIREVTGYVLIWGIEVNRILLPRLEIVRGQSLSGTDESNRGFALLGMSGTAESLQFPCLRHILDGDVYFQDIDNLCYINWSEILSGSSAKVVYAPDPFQTNRECPSCHESCEAGCWGEGPQNCQLFSNISCLPQCNQGRCCGLEPRQCCHLFSAVGCAGPTQAYYLLASLLVIGYFSKQIIMLTV